MSDEKTLYPVQPAPFMPPPQPNQYGAPPPTYYNQPPNYPSNYTQPGYVQPAIMLQPSVIVNAGVPRLTTSPQHLSKYLKDRRGQKLH